MTAAIRHSLSDRGNDCYETPPQAVHALLRAEEIPLVVWEPACGPGSIAKTLRGAGRCVYATDLVNYESPDQDQSGWDFLMETQLPIGVKAIITNPPFKIAADFVAHGLELCPLVIMLLRLSFLESESRTEILDGGQLARVHVFSNRLPQMHRRGWEGPKSSSTVCYAWFVWDRDHRSPTTIDRISWR